MPTRVSTSSTVLLHLIHILRLPTSFTPTTSASRISSVREQVSGSHTTSSRSVVKTSLRSAQVFCSIERFNYHVMKAIRFPLLQLVNILLPQSKADVSCFVSNSSILFEQRWFHLVFPPASVLWRGLRCVYHPRSLELLVLPEWV